MKINIIYHSNKLKKKTLPQQILKSFWQSSTPIHDYQEKENFSTWQRTSVKNLHLLYEYADMPVWGPRLYEKSLYAAQLCCESKIALKIVYYKTKNNNKKPYYLKQYIIVNKASESTHTSSIQKHTGASATEKKRKVI